MYAITREAQDEFALRSHRSPPPPARRARWPRWCRCPASSSSATRASAPTRSLEKLAKLKPAFVEGGTVTAGNSSPLNDGAAMLLLGSEAAAARIGAAPLARVVSRGVHGVDPDVFGIAPVEAANKALARAGIGWGDVDVVELNEAFASQSAGLPRRLARARPGEGEHPRRRDRDRPPARRLRRPRSSAASPTSCAHAAAATASRRSASASARAWRWCSNAPKGPSRAFALSAACGVLARSHFWFACGAKVRTLS